MKRLSGASHNGTINLKEGSLTTDGKSITGGEFVVDMNSIKNEDVKDAGSRAKLEGHLKSDDFFGVAKFPFSRLVLTEQHSIRSG
ncbi:MAG: YceI family protein [Marinilabiliales bacterium]|nr:YceI family protein [Marinilabiliales bacterium]